MTGSGLVTVNVSVLGDAELSRALTRIPKKVANSVVRPALRKGVKPVKARAEATAPRARGLMATTMAIKTSSRRGRISAKVLTGRRDQLGIPAGAKYYYPAAQELGSEHVPEQRFLRGALEGQSAEVLQVVADEMWRRLEALGLGRESGGDEGS